MLLLFLSGVENLSRSEEAFTKNVSVGSGFISYKPGMVTERKNLQAFLFLVLKLPSYFDFKLITRVLQYLSG